MENFFKIDGMVVDVEEGRIYLPTGKTVNINFDDMTLKDYQSRTKLTPIRFSSEKQLLVWNQAKDKWVPIKSYYEQGVVAAINKLIEVKIEKDLLE